MTTQRLKPAVFAIAAAIALAGCENTNTLDPSQITLVSLDDSFSFSATALDNVSDGERYLMAITGTQAAIDVTQAITSGTAILQIRDAAGTIRYQEDISDAVDSVTVASVAGLWQVDIALTKVSGEFSFTVIRAP